MYKKLLLAFFTLSITLSSCIKEEYQEFDSTNKFTYYVEVSGNPAKVNYKVKDKRYIVNLDDEEWHNTSEVIVGDTIALYVSTEYGCMYNIYVARNGIKTNYGKGWLPANNMVSVAYIIN